MAIIICLFYRLSRSGEHMPNVGFFATSHPIKACFLCFALASSGCWANTLQMSIEGAESGDVLEQYNLALAYANGDGVMQDYEVAADWYTRAAAQGYIDAQYNLALAYINGEGVKQNYEAAAKWYTKAAEQGDIDAQYALGVLHFTGRGGARDYHTAVKWFIRAAEQGHLAAQSYLGDLYGSGLVVILNYDTAAKWYAKAAEQGQDNAQYNLGVFYHFGMGVVKNYVTAVDWYAKAAEQGHQKAQFTLGLAYSIGEGVKQDYKSAANWFRKAAEQGNSDAQGELGLAYYRGQGIKQSYEAAAEWFFKAAQQGHSHAQYNLALAYVAGKGVPQDHETAAKWYTKAAEQGYDDAQYNLALAFMDGKGLTQNHEVAVKWYAKAAEQGHLRAQYNLALAYSNGEGVSQDYEVAAKWYARAAEQGHSGAQHNLGLAYNKGEGVPQNHATAARWYAKAAQQGHLAAQNALGVAYQLGEGVTQNSLTAAAWYKRAASKLDSIALSNLDLLNSAEGQIYTASALEYQKRSFDTGKMSAGYGIALKHLDKSSGFYHPEAAFDVLQLAIDTGDDNTKSTSLTLLGYMYAEGVYVSKDIGKALNLFVKVDPVDIDSSVFELVLPTLISTLTPELLQKFTPPFMAYLDEFCTNDYFEGRGFAENPIWPILQSINFVGENLVDRCFDEHVSSEIDSKNYQKVSERYQKGVPGLISINEKKAFEYMRLAAISDNESRAAMHLVGSFYEGGYGTAKRKTDALFWYKKAAALGFSTSLNRLGRAHEKGELGFKADLVQAFDHYQRAYYQDETCSPCMTNLGRMYAGGEAVKQDYSMAKIYYTKASRLGDLRAGNLLASLESEGLAGPENKPEAVAILERILLGNAGYKALVGAEEYDKEIVNARKFIASLGAIDKAKAALNLGEYHALIIGNSNYENLVNLPTAENDASEIAELLEQDYGFSVELAIDVTRNETLNSLNRFRRELKANDNFLLYYAGHGVIDELGKGHWQPVNVAKGDDCVECISNDTIKSTLKKFKANNILLIADSCFAGTITRGFGLVDEVALEELPPPNKGDTLLERLNRLKTRIAMTSGDLEPVADRIEFSEHSVFAESLIQALKNNFQVTKSGDIFEKVQQRVVTISADHGVTQTPVHSPIIAAGHEGGDFIFERVTN